MVRPAAATARHQGVGVGLAQGGGHAVLLLEQQPLSSRPARRWSSTRSAVSVARASSMAAVST